MRIYLLFLFVFLINWAESLAQENGTFTDPRDGKIYKTIKIGPQTWMAENLAWKAPSECWAYNNNDTLGTTYGYLYTWETATRSCPIGWHLPDNSEWQKLVENLGGDTLAGGKLKAESGEQWKSPNPGANNESRFAALPAGNRSGFNGEFYGLGKYTFWWSSTEFSKTGEIYVRSIDNLSTQVSEGKNNREFGYSVRCIKN